MPKKDGFPEPLFEKYSELLTLAEDYDDELIYLMFEPFSIGALRQADPILGDLTVMAREAIGRVSQRLAEIQELEARAKAKAAAIRANRVEGAVPEDQA